MIISLKNTTSIENITSINNIKSEFINNNISKNNKIKNSDSDFNNLIGFFFFVMLISFLVYITYRNKIRENENMSQDEINRKRFIAVTSLLQQRKRISLLTRPNYNKV